MIKKLGAFRVLGVLVFFHFSIGCQPAKLNPPAVEVPPKDDQQCVAERDPTELQLAYDDGPEVSESAGQSANPNFNTPTRLLPKKDWPRFSDDLDFENMDLAIDRQLKRFRQLNLNGTINLGGARYPTRLAVRSLERFRDLTRTYKACLILNSKMTCENHLNEAVAREFNIFMPELKPSDPRYGEPKQTLFTAYYTPTLAGRLERSGDFQHGVYRNPKNGDEFKFSRVEIDFQNKLAGRGLEIFYALDLFDLYLLQVQGGGRVDILDPNQKTQTFYISYGGTNKKSFSFISKYMLERGYIQSPSIEAQRDFLAANPDKQQEIYATSPSYVYFSVTDHPPFGSDSVPLTDDRSIATDTNFYRFKGLLSFVNARRPAQQNGDKKKCGPRSLKFKNYSRFYLDQDTGGAIRGKARVDLYFGESAYAEKAAYNIVERGDLYFLLLKP